MSAAKRVAVFAAAGILFVANAGQAGAYTTQEEQELQIGRAVYQQLERKGQIVTNSPAYAILNPLGKRIAAVADKRYFVPFHFILVHDPQPNAFAVPGGNVYVTDAMMSFVQSKEELAGVLCHEVSHDIHHDVYDLYVKGQRISLWATLAQLLIGQRSRLTSFAIDLLANVEALRFSREVERSADSSGAYICADAGVSPWGMVWLMRRFAEHPTSNPPEFLSNHPTDSHRIADLERLFQENAGVFRQFNMDAANATPLHEPDLRDQLAVRFRPGTSSRNGANTAPAKSGAAPKRGCPPGWKFCPKTTPRGKASGSSSLRKLHRVPRLA